MASPEVALRALKFRIENQWVNKTHEETRQLLIKMAKAGHDKIMRQQASRESVFPTWHAYANTEGNPNINTVKLPGPIVYKYNYDHEIFIVGLRFLQQMSPHNTGRYRQGHTLFINDRAVKPGTPIRHGDRIFIANPVVYARRLEVGKTEAGRDFLISVPNKIYERVTKNILIPRYRNVAKIYMGYVTLPEAYIIKGKLAPAYRLPNGKMRKRRQKKGDPVRSPAIFIEPFT